MTGITATTLAFIQSAGQAGRAAAQEMTQGGWVFVVAAWFCILALVYFTFSKVLSGKK